jgi:hypothetical protein
VFLYGAVSVIIPTLNEADDDTQRVAKVLRPDVCMVHEFKRGKSAAMKAGLYAGTSEYLIALDAGGSMDGTEIGAFRDTLSLASDGFEVETLIGMRARLKTAEVPCYESNRIHGASNLRAFHDGLRIFRTIVSERLRRYRVRAN